MKAKLLAFLFFLVVLPQAALSLTTAFEGWVYSGQTATVEGKTFIIYEAASRMEMLAEHEGISLFIVNNSCQQRGNARLCLDNIEYDFAAKKDKMKVRAISLAPDISITRSADDNEFEAGDGATITVTIKNGGGLAQNLTYTDIFPESVEIVSVDGIRKLPHGVEWKEHSLKAESVSFSYTIKVNDVMDTKLVAVLDYFNGEKMKRMRSTTLGIKTTPRLLHEFIYKGGSSFIGETKNITLNFTSRETSTARVSVDLFVDSGVVLTRIPNDFRKAGENRYHADIQLRKSPSNKTYNRTQNYYFEFKGLKAGTFKIRAATNYSTDDVFNRKLPDLEQSVAFSNKGVDVRTNLQDFELESNQQRTLRIWLQNLNPKAGIKNILARIDGGGLVDLPDAYIGNLGPADHSKIIELAFYAPEANVSKGYTIEVNVSYETEFGDNFSKRFAFTETVSKVSDMAIASTVSNPALESGEEATVTVKVKNPRTTKISGIRVMENVSGDFTVIGAKSAVMELGANDEQTAYTYVIRAPRVLQEKDYYINTTVSYSDGNAAQDYYSARQYEVTKALSVKVKPQKFELTATRTVDDSDLYVGDFFDVDYVFKNPSTGTTAEKIEVVIPVQPEFDLADTTRTISVGRLEPGEEISVTGKVKGRAKRAGSSILEKARVTYSNEFGEMFEVNVTGTTIKVKEKASSDTFVSVTKETKAQVNNTDVFEVVLNATARGMGIIGIVLEDGEFRRDFAINNGSSAAFSYLKRIEAPGKHSLAPATAAYTFRGSELVTGSDSPEIEVIENQVISVEKLAPSTVDSAENFEIEIKVKSLTGSVTNLTVHEGGKELHYDKVSGEISHKYETRIRQVGASQLPGASVSYMYNGVLYETVSNSPTVNVVERQLLTVSKSVSVKEAMPGDEVQIFIKAVNNANHELSAAISDDGRTWEIKLAPGEEKTVDYRAKAHELGAATATYTYNDEERTATSQVPEFSLVEEKGKVIKEENEKGAVRRIIDMILGVLTWQRG